MACRQLYHVLQCQAHPAPRRSRVVVACNKVDLEERAFSQDFIVKQLEKEMCGLSPCYPPAISSAMGLAESLPETFT